MFQFLQLSSTKPVPNSLVHYPMMSFSIHILTDTLLAEIFTLEQVLENIPTAQRMSLITTDRELPPTTVCKILATRLSRDTNTNQM